MEAVRDGIARRVFSKRNGVGMDSRGDAAAERPAIHRAVRRKKKRDDIASVDELMRVLESQDFKCALTGVPLTFESASLDHKIPVCRGGGHTTKNLWFIDRAVNRAKHTMSVGDFVAMCEAVVKWTGQQQSLKACEDQTPGQLHAT